MTIPNLHLENDPHVTLEFLKEMLSDGPWHLVAIQDGKPKGRSFDAEDTAGVLSWVAQSFPGANHYFHVNRLKRSPAKGKAEKSDVAEALFLHMDVDLDDPSPENLARTLARMQAVRPAFTAIVFTGGGYHGYYRLEEPCSDLDLIERLNANLAKALGGDKCQSVDHIMRLPGTVNWLNKSKVAKGRVPALAHVVEMDGSRKYPIRLLKALFKGGEIVQIANGEPTHNPALPLTVRLARAAPDDDQICAIVESWLPPGYRGDLPKELPRMVRGARDIIAKGGQDRNDEVEEDLDLLFDQLCRKHKVVGIGSDMYVVDFEEKEKVHNGRVIYTEHVKNVRSLRGFRNLYLNRFVQVDDKRVPLAEWWLKNKRRPTYKRLELRPDVNEEVVDGCINLWRGFGVEAKQGDWSLMREHIRSVIAGGDTTLGEYILDWLAWAVQNPHRRAEVALVLLGGQGTGKGTVGNAMCRIFGQHANHISNVEHLVGRFNGYLQETLLLFADEAYWGGNKGGLGTLKSLITEPKITIEPKGIDATEMDNRLHIIMASNEDWAIPAGEDERRFAVIRVSEERRQSQEWFKPLYDQLENGGYQAMLHDLLHRDLGEWHPREVPKTDALRDQQARSLLPQNAWLLGLFQDGELPGATGDLPDHAPAYARKDSEGKSPRNGLFEIAKERVPALRNTDWQILARYLRQWGCTLEHRRSGNLWKFPPLLECRKRWDEKYGPHGWSDIADWLEPKIEDDTEPKREWKEPGW